jgi:hypothetical protein
LFFEFILRKFDVAKHKNEVLDCATTLGWSPDCATDFCSMTNDELSKDIQDLLQQHGVTFDVGTSWTQHLFLPGVAGESPLLLVTYIPLLLLFKGARTSGMILLKICN